MHESEYRLDGLAASVEILIDEWGVPHIYAAQDGDLYFAQGFNAARDRLFQIDLWRRRGLGLLAEVFGPECVAQDRALRLFLYRGDMQQEWAAYGERASDVAASFTAGINAYIDLCRDDPTLLPEEFAALGYLPSRWHADDIARIRSHGLYQNSSRRSHERARWPPTARRSRTCGASASPPWTSPSRTAWTSVRSRRTCSTFIASRPRRPSYRPAP